LFDAVHKDIIYHSLVQEWDHDDIVVMYLNVMLLNVLRKCMLITFQAANDIHTYIRMKEMSVQKHNKFSESEFGYLDNLLRKKNISVLASQAYIMLTANKTEDWIEQTNQRNEESSNAGELQE